MCFVIDVTMWHIKSLVPFHHKFRFIWAFLHQALDIAFHLSMGQWWLTALLKLCTCIIPSLHKNPVLWFSTAFVSMTIYFGLSQVKCSNFSILGFTVLYVIWRWLVVSIRHHLLYYSNSEVVYRRTVELSYGYSNMCHSKMIWLMQ
jgi:hypothetical protein